MTRAFTVLTCLALGWAALSVLTLAACIRWAAELDDHTILPEAS